MVKDRPGGVLATVLRYFTRELPPGLGAGDSLGAVAVAPGEPEHAGEAIAPANAPVAGRFSGLADVTLLASEAVDIPLQRLGALTPPVTPDLSERDVGLGLVA